MDTLALIWSSVGLVLTLIACTPFLGSLNWLVMPINGVGVVASAIAWALAHPNHRQGAVTALAISGSALVLSAVRLFAGCGVL